MLILPLRHLTETSLTPPLVLIVESILFPLIPTPSAHADATTHGLDGIHVDALLSPGVVVHVVSPTLTSLVAVHTK
jgi:hypothetical protein